MFSIKIGMVRRAGRLFRVGPKSITADSATITSDSAVITSDAM